MDNKIIINFDDNNDYIYININNHCLKVKIPTKINKKYLKNENSYNSYINKLIMIEIIKYKKKYKIK